MILYTNGCSWTWGGSLDHLFCLNGHYEIENEKRLALLWPHHLGKLLEAAQVHNLADGCGSNQRIVRTTYNWLRSKTPEELSETVAVIQFTQWSRFEFYDPLNPNDEWEDYPGDWVKAKVDVVVKESGYKPRKDNYRELLDKANNIIKNTHPLEDFYRTISYIYALKGLFESFKIKDYYIWHHGHDWHFLPLEHRQNIFDHFKVLDEVHDWQPWRYGPDYWVYDRVSPDDWHPSVQGHIDLAHIIKDRMIRKGYKA
jgi:hypothetical protein